MIKGKHGDYLLRGYAGSKKPAIVQSVTKITGRTR